MKCCICSSDFDLESRQPRILPCGNSICLQCIHSSKQLLTGYRITCKCSVEEHKLKSLADLYPCEMILSLLRLRQVDSENDPGDHLKCQVDASRISLDVAKYEAQRHYDAMEMNIDLRTETLIEFIHEKRDCLRLQVKSFREKTDEEFEELRGQHERGLKCIDLTYKKMVENGKDTSSMREFMVDLNGIQREVEQVKLNMWHFFENSDKLDSCLLGKFLNKSFENVYLKVKNVKSYLEVRFSIFLKFCWSIRCFKYLDICSIGSNGKYFRQKLRIYEKN